jgi:hypothetical protein
VGWDGWQQGILDDTLDDTSVSGSIKFHPNMAKFDGFG